MVDSVRVTLAVVGGIEIQERVYPCSHRDAPVEPSRAYVAVVLDGAVEKQYASTSYELGRGSAVTTPVGAAHSAHFGRDPTRVICVRPLPNGEVAAAWDPLLGRLRHVRSAFAPRAAWRVAAELHATDSAWSLAAEGAALDLLAGLARGVDDARRKSPPTWLVDARELLHSEPSATPTVRELAATVGVHPAHLSRTFRAHYGTTIGDYVRTLRLEWAAAELTRTDVPLNVLALQAGFADQSHFTRAFKARLGVTPGRYRELARE